MNDSYERDFDLNLLRVFVVVAEAGSVTQAARRLYLTQPAVSAALRRLGEAVGGRLFARAGRGLLLTPRGERLLESARPHLDALVSAALAPAAFDPRTSERTVRIGLSDMNETWLVPALLRALAGEAPRMRLIVTTTQFRSVSEALGSRRIDFAVTVADDLPTGTLRYPLFRGGFACLYDPRRARLPKKLTLERYLAHEHVIVSYNGDLHGIVEDLLGLKRRARISVPSFQSVGTVVEGTPLLATVPLMIARQILAQRPRLRTTRLPLKLEGTPMELLCRSGVDDDEALAFVRAQILRIAKTAVAGTPGGPASARAGRAPARERAL